MRPHSVLFVDHARACGGAENFLLSFLEQLDRNRFVPHLATRAGRFADAARALNVTVHDVPLSRLRSEQVAAWRLAQGVAALVRIIRREHIALVHSNTMRASFYVAAAAKLTRRPFVWHVHEIVPPGAYVRVMCAACDAAIAVSAAAAAPLPRTPKVRVIHNGVRLEDFEGDRREQAARLRAAWGVPPDAILVGQVARLQPRKGQRDVVAAAELLVRQLPNVYVAIVGGDIFGDAAEYEQELKAAVAQAGLTGRIILTGHQPDVPAVLSSLDILVHASEAEPFPMILLEAGAAGLPIVAYAAGGVREALVHEKAGLLVAPGDRRGLAAAVHRLATAPALRRDLGAAARAEIAARFDVRRAAAQIEQMFQDVLT